MDIRGKHSNQENDQCSGGIGSGDGQQQTNGSQDLANAGEIHDG